MKKLLRKLTKKRKKLDRKIRRRSAFIISTSDYNQTPKSKRHIERTEELKEISHQLKLTIDAISLYYKI